MPFEDLLKQLQERTARALAMGGAEKLARRKAEGHLNARERIDYLIDDGSFVESGMFAAGIRPEVRNKTPADAKVAGFARIDGREVALVSNDFTVLGASSSVINMKKIKHVKQVASRRGLPMILAKGLAAFLNSTLVDVYFRQFNGHTQVNATDLRSLNYPTMKQLERLGRKTEGAGLAQAELDVLVEGELF